jgi:hypothetical protein
MPCELTPQHELQLDTSRGLKRHKHSANTRELNDRLRDDLRSIMATESRPEWRRITAGRDGVATRSASIGVSKIFESE